jgi:hypothetical protein
MVCEYVLPLVCRCPVDSTVVDSYTVTVTAAGMIRVEDLVAELDKYRDRVIFQEDVTRALANALGARVETVGSHSGVKTRCVCEASHAS